MGHESYAQSFLGIIISLQDIRNVFEKWNLKETYDDCSDDYYLENSIYYDFVKKIIKKHKLGYEEISFQSEDGCHEIELCVFVWKQETEWMCGYNACGRIASNCDFVEIQECIEKKRENLKSFMQEFGLEKEIHKLQMCTLVYGG